MLLPVVAPECCLRTKGSPKAKSHALLPPPHPPAGQHRQPTHPQAAAANGSDLTTPLPAPRANLTAQRWYPTALAMPNGEVWVPGGTWAQKPNGTWPKAVNADMVRLCVVCVGGGQARQVGGSKATLFAATASQAEAVDDAYAKATHSQYSITSQATK